MMISLCDRVEYIIGEEKNIGHQHFLLLPKFVQSLLPKDQDCVVKGELMNSLPHNPKEETTVKKKPFENIAGKGENAGNQHFLLFTQCFLHIPKKKKILLVSYIYIVCRCFQFWTCLKFCHLVKS